MRSERWEGINVARDGATANAMDERGIVRTITRNMCHRLIAPSQSDKGTWAIDTETIVSYILQIYSFHLLDNETNQILIQAPS